MILRRLLRCRGGLPNSCKLRNKFSIFTREEHVDSRQMENGHFSTARVKLGHLTIQRPDSRSFRANRMLSRQSGFSRFQRKGLPHPVTHQRLSFTNIPAQKESCFPQRHVLCHTAKSAEIRCIGAPRAILTGSDKADMLAWAQQDPQNFGVCWLTDRAQKFSPSLLHHKKSAGYSEVSGGTS